jgi:hypothetical protein
MIATAVIATLVLVLIAPALIATGIALGELIVNWHERRQS